MFSDSLIYQLRYIGWLFNLNLVGINVLWVLNIISTTRKKGPNISRFFLKNENETFWNAFNYSKFWKELFNNKLKAPDCFQDNNNINSTYVYDIELSFWILLTMCFGVIFRFIFSEFKNKLNKVFLS